jgi:hypothetical protein
MVMLWANCQLQHRWSDTWERLLQTEDRKLEYRGLEVDGELDIVLRTGSVQNLVTDQVNRVRGALNLDLLG